MIAAYINNMEEGIQFFERYGIEYRLNEDKKLEVYPVPVEYYHAYQKMEKIARKNGGIDTDHPYKFLNFAGDLIVTFSPYNSELTEENRKKVLAKGYDIRECEYDLYGSGTKTFVMAKLVSPLEE